MLSLFAVSTASAQSLGIRSGVVAPGDTVTVPIEMTAEVQDVYGYQLDLTVTPSSGAPVMYITGVAKGSAATITTEIEIHPPVPVSGSVRIGLPSEMPFPGGVKSSFDGPGSIADLEFVIPASAVVGQSYQFDLSNVILVGPDGTAVSLTVLGGTLTVGNASALADTIISPGPISVDEQSSTPVVPTVTGGGQPIPGVELQFGIDNPAIATLSSSTAVTGSDGEASIDVTGVQDGTTTIRISAFGLGETTVTLTVVGITPWITSTPQLEVAEDSTYTYDVNATDPQSDTLTYSLSVSPAGMTIDPATGVINWPVPVDQSQEGNDVTVEVRDPLNNINTQSFSIFVTRDRDGDGYDDRVDCDDSNASINPVADEICDNVDNNCDGTIDEGFDNDGDGFANCNDCNDNNPLISPAATEVCDDIDNNCNGQIDEGFPTSNTYYLDNDGDGYGDPLNSRATCLALPPAGYVIDNTDCNDSNSNINPGVGEVAENGLDDDCNPATLDNYADTFMIATDDNGRVYYASSNGNGTWSDYRQVIDLPGNAIRGAAIADYDNDGDLDFLIPAHPGGNTLNIYLFTNDGADNFTNVGVVASSAVSGGGAYGMTTADFNNDGFMDFIISRNGSYIVVGLGDGLGGFSVSEFNSSLGNGRGMDAADFDHDGNMDFVRSRSSSGQIHLWRGDGTGNFVNVGLVGDPGTDPYGVTAGDFDNDGHADVIANYGSNGDAYFYKGNGNGSFNSGIYVGSIDFGNYGAYDNYDFNGDGNQDIITTSYSSRVIRFYPGNGNGTFGPAVRVNPSNTPGNILGVSAPAHHAFGTPYAVIRPAEQTIPLGNVANLDGSDSNDNDDVDGSIASWSWDFGDGAMGTGETVSHAYASEGVYNVALKVTDNDGYIAYARGKVTVIGAPPVAVAGPYTFGETFADGDVYTVNLDGSGSTDDAGIVKYEWDYGNYLEDDFAGTTLDTGKWIASAGVVQNEKATITGAGSWSNRYLYSQDNFKREAGVTFQARFRPVNVSGNQRIMFGFKNTSASYHYNQLTYAFYFTNNTIHIYEDGAGRGQHGTYVRNVEYDIKIVLKSTGANYYVRVVGNSFWTLIYNSGHSSLSTMKVGWTALDSTYDIDDVVVSLPQEGVSPTRILQKGTYPVTLTVTDIVGQQDSVTTTISTIFNNPPTADAGGPYSVDETVASEGGWSATLDGSGSTDDVEINRYIWDFGVDTFSGTVLDSGKWYTNGGISRNDLVSLAGANTWNTRYMVSRDTFPKAKGQTFQTKLKVSGGGQCMLGFKNSNTSNFHYNQFPYEFYLYNGNVYIYEKGSSRGDTGFNFSYNTWYDYKIELKNAGAVYSYRQSGTTDWIVVYDSGYTTGDTSLRKGIVVHSNTWNIDDFVETTVGVSPTYRFYGTGIYSVDLTVYDRVNQSHTDSSSVQVSAGDPPVANAGLDQTLNETNAVDGVWTVNFDASGSTDVNGIYTYEWDWNYDGSTFNPSGNTEATPSHSWDVPGVYTVAVRVSDNALQTHVDTMIVTITQGNPPSADAGGPYSVDEITGNAFQGGWTVTLDGSGSNDNETSIAKYVWDLGTDTFNGTVLNEGKWAHSSNVIQNNELSVPVSSNGWGKNYFFSKDTYTRAKGMAFEARVKHNSSSVMVGFKNTNTTYHYNQMTYAIYFAGTNINIYENGSSRGDTGKDAPYNTWYDVRIELKENAGAMYYYRVSGAPDWILLYDSNYSSAASFKRGADVNAGTFVIDDLKEIAAGVNPTYRFYGFGGHPVSLTVWDQAYQTHTDSSNVTTQGNDVPVADAGPDKSGDETDAFEGTWIFDFDGSNSTDDHGIFTYEWDWDYDGTDFNPSGDTAVTLSHTFSGAGIYTVALRVTDHALQSTIDTATVSLVPGDPPVARAGDDITTEGHWPVIFNGGNSTDDFNIYKYKWDFGDGTTGTGKTPTHIYWSQGDYTVTLTVIDNILQSDSDTLIVHVVTGNAPVADAGGPYNAGAGGPPAYLNGSSSTDDYGIVKYLWDVDANVDSDGDGNFTNDMDVVGRKPFYTYSTAGTYTATLTVVDGAGQTDTDTATVNVAANLAPDVICVPWVGTDPLSRHETYNGRSIKLKAIVRDAGNLTYQWNFGDGSALYPATPAVVSDKYEIEVSHTYPNSPDNTPFTATLSVWDSNGLKGSDYYHLIVKPDDYDTRTNIAIDEGLWYLHKTQNRSNGRWTYGGYVAPPTGSSIQAFEINGHLQDGDNQENPYVETVSKGFTSLFTTLRSSNINYQPYMTHGNPDTNGNGIGIEVNNGQPIYQGGMVMDAIASSNTPLAVATTGGANIKGRFFYEILTDMVDMYSYGQVESGGARGGWRYSWHSSADNSACQWAAIGMTAAEDNFGINVPQFVKDENNVWLNHSYNGSGFGYTTGGNTTAGVPSGMVQLTFADKRTTDPRWRTAEDYLATHWSTWSGTNYYATYALVKSLRLAQPDPVVTFSATGFDWYNNSTSGIRKRLVDAQRSNGGWYGSGHALSYSLHTPWVVIMLTPTLFVQPPVADAGDDIIWAYDHEITFDASGTFHKDPIRSIVKYEWDFDGDGTWDFETTDPSDPDAKFTYPDPNPNQNGDPLQVYQARLRVTDDNDPSQTDIDIRKVTVAEPPHAPFAITGGPYTATTGIPFTLDGSGSSDIDPGDTITSYQWDLDDDGVWFDDVDIDTTNATVPHTYTAPGVYQIGLKVWDNGGFNPIGCAYGVDCISMESTPDFTSVTVVTNAPPVADAGGPYVVDEGAQITFDGSGSSDPNGDPITFSWDLDNDGQYDDATGTAPSFLGVDDGVFNVGLFVTDTLLDETASSTVTVNNVAPAVDAGPDQIVNEGDAVNFSGSFTDPGVNDTHTISWDFGDGSPVVTGVLTPSHTYPPDDGIYTVNLTVTDDDGGVGNDTLTVTVNNVAPSVDAGPDQTINEGDTVNFSGSFTDPGVNDTHTYSWDFGDSSPTDSSTLTPNHTYPDNGTYTVTLTVTDDDLGVGSDTLTVTVNNVAPSVDAGPDQIVDEGDTVIFSGSFTDPGSLDNHTATINWGDGSAVDTGTVVQGAGNGTVSGSHVYPTAGEYTVTVTVTDDDGGTRSDTFMVTVNSTLIPNTPPTVEAGPDQTVNEGTNVSFNGSFTDPDTGNIHTISWDFGDGSAAVSGTLTPSHTYTSDGAFTVTLTVTDDDLGVGSDTLIVTVNFDLIAVAKCGRSGCKVQLVWTPVAGAVCYNIYRSEDNGGSYVRIANCHVTDYSTYQDNNVSVGTTYCYQVTSVDSKSNEFLSSSETCATPTQTVRRRR